MKYMMIVSLLIIFPTLHVRASVRTCANVNHFSFLHRNKQIVDEPFGRIHDRGLVQCARDCMLTQICKSFSFEYTNGECLLFKSAIEESNVDEKYGTDISSIEDWSSKLAGPCKHSLCPVNTICQVKGFSKICMKTSCPSPPKIENAEPQFDLTDAHTSLGSTLVYKCHLGFAAKHGLNIITCQLGQNWTSISCIPLRSCLDVRDCNSRYDDGEYWMTPVVLDNKPVKIYCHEMNSESPKEFVSLPVPNKGVYPNVTNKDCTRETLLSPIYRYNAGTTVYSKIRVNVQKMRVGRHDGTFTETEGAFQEFAETGDCYAPEKSVCCPKGKFEIDTTGTGLIVQGVKFICEGHQEKCDFLYEDSKITLRCGGLPGDCKPFGAVLLGINPLEVLPESNARIAICSST